MRLKGKSRFVRSWIIQNVRKTYVVFIVLAVVFGTYFTFAVPIGYTHDETVHAFRAYQLQAGQFFSHPVQKQVIHGKTYILQGGDVANAIIDLEQLTGAGSRIEALCKVNGPCKKPSPEVQKLVAERSERKVIPTEKSAIHTWGASYYFFASYLPAAIGMQVAELLHSSAANMIYAARLGNVIAFAAIVGWAIYLLRNNKSNYLFFSIGLFPLTISLAAGLGVDMLLNATALLLFALMVRAHEQAAQLPRSLRIVLFVSAALIPVLKLPYIFISLAVLFLPIYGVGRKAWLWRIATLLLILLPTLGWNIATADMVQTQAAMSSTPGGDLVSTSGQIDHIKGHPLDFIIVLLRSIFTQNWLQYMGGITQQGVAFPAIIYYLEFVPILIASYIAALHFNLTSRRSFVAFTMLGCALSALLAIFASLYISYTPIGGSLILGVQGRYLIPALPFLFFGIALSLKKYLKPLPRMWNKPLYLYVTYIVLLTICAVWYHYKVYIWV